MKRVLFFEIPEFTGATRVTRLIKKRVSGWVETKTAVIHDVNNPCAEIQKAIELELPDLIFCSFSVINCDVISEAKSKKITVIVRQDYNYKDLPEKIRKKMGYSYPEADWVIVQTPEMKQDLLDEELLRACRIKVFDNPIDEEDILNKIGTRNPFPDNGNIHYLWVGRKDPIKDLPTLEKAFKIVQSQLPNSDLTLISGEDNPYKWINNADCLVISSKSEASPNVLKEALFLGKIVVSTNCSPMVRKLLPDNRIAEVGNAEALASVMLRSVYNNDNCI